LRSGQVDPTPLITNTFALNDAPEAMRFAQRRDVMKVLLKPENAASV
jgi:threonine dehydrogenase-like Zn-dependent dehydrogenase